MIWFSCHTDNLLLLKQNTYWLNMSRSVCIYTYIYIYISLNSCASRISSLFCGGQPQIWQLSLHETETLLGWFLGLCVLSQHGSKQESAAIHGPSSVDSHWVLKARLVSVPTGCRFVGEFGFSGRLTQVQERGSPFMSDLLLRPVPASV